MIEDLISTGGSSVGVVNAVKEAGGVVKQTLAIFTYEMEKAKKAFEEAQCELLTLSDFSTLIKVATQLGNITNEEAQITLDWNKDTQGWGKKMGFE